MSTFGSPLMGQPILNFGGPKSVCLKYQLNSDSCSETKSRGPDERDEPVFATSQASLASHDAQLCVLDSLSSMAPGIVPATLFGFSL